MRFPWSREPEQQKEEEKADYSKLSNDQLLDRFKSTNWNSLDDAHKLAVAQEFENRNAAGQGRPPAQVVSIQDSRFYGQYNDQTNILYLNMRDFSSYDVLDTCVHEGTHADQNARIARLECQGNATQSMIQAESARDERGVLYNYKSNGPLYSLQCNEMESNNEAATFLLSQAPRYGEDPVYREYIEKRTEYYSQVNKDMETQRDARIELQNQQALMAFAHGDITEEQFNDITGSLSREDYLDTEAIRTQELNVDLQELQEQYVGEDMEAETEDEAFDYTDTAGQAPEDYGTGGFDYTDTAGQAPGGYGTDGFDDTGDAGQLAGGQDRDSSGGQDRDGSSGQESGQSM